MDENSPVYENFLNKMSGSMPIRGTTRRVSASKFLGRDDLESKVESNSRKITILRRIISARRIKTGENISQLSRASSVANIESIVKDLVRVTTSITETLQRQEKINQQIYERNLRLEESEKRRQREEKLEGRLSGIKKTFSKVVQPVMSLFERMATFMFSLITGRFFTFLLDPKNANFLKGILGFFTNFFPAIITGFVLFGTSLGRLFFRISLAVITKLPALSRLLLTLLRRNPAVFALATGAVVGGGFLLKNLFNDDQMENDNVEEDINLDDTTNLTPGQNINMNDTPTSGSDININVNQEEDKVPKFNLGGFVRGPGGIDKVPARLTAGEFVMTRGAVQKFGVGTLSAMNSIAGGTNRPKGGNYYNGGMALTQDFSNVMGDNNFNFSPQTLNNVNIDPPMDTSQQAALPPITETVEQQAEPSTGMKNVPHFETGTFREDSKVRIYGIA